MRTPLNFPENLTLSTATDHGTNGKQVTFYNAFTMRLTTEKHPQDHEQFMAIQDCKLLAALIDTFYDAIKVHVAYNELPGVWPGSNLPARCMENLKMCYRALCNNRDRGEFDQWPPYSPVLIYQCTVAICQALKVLKPPYEHSNATTIYRLLIDINQQAQRRYEVDTVQLPQTIE